MLIHLQPQPVAKSQSGEDQLARGKSREIVLPEDPRLCGPASLSYEMSGFSLSMQGESYRIRISDSALKARSSPAAVVILMTVIAILQTERLLLQPLQLTDAERTQRLFPQWEIVKFLSTQIPWPYPADGAFIYYRDVALPAIERGEQWHWTLRLRQSPEEHIGSVGLIAKDGHATRGFWLGLPWQGQGLMTEAVIAVNNYCFDVLGFTVLRVPKAVVNIASRRVSEKTGMRVIGSEEREYVSGRFLTEIWEITALEWREKRQLIRANEERS